MAKLFIFAIGGTGSRVLKSLIMLLASGAKPNTDKEYEIVPIMIDPHKTNEDLKRTLSLLDNYQAITNKAGIGNGFFSTKILKLCDLTASQDKKSENFTFNLQKVADSKFRDYIEFNQMDEANKGLTDILFSGNSINKNGEKVDLLDVEMDIGFVGNPNIGSVVLNQFKDSEEFKDFASNYNQDDRIFIISSIFGGTGAAGFPTVLKNIRNAINNNNIDSRSLLENSKIGALTVLPYFNIEKKQDSPIQKSDFIAKTKDALNYYKDNISGNNSINALYYIYDDLNGLAYPNDPGTEGQKNPAHVVELFSALAVLDFLEISDNDLLCTNGKAETPIYKEFGVKNDTTDLKFSDLENKTELKISLPLSQFLLFHKYINEHFDETIEIQAWSNNNPVIDNKFTNENFYRTNLIGILDSYKEWLIELKNNKRGFSPFNIDSEIEIFIKGRIPRTGLFSKRVDYSMFDDKLNKISRKNYASNYEKLVKLFYEATREILTSKFGMKKYE